MKTVTIRPARMGLNASLAVVLAILGLGDVATSRAWGQCTPQELPKVFALDAGPDDFFGFAMAVSGDTAVVGAHNEQTTTFGAAYVFVRSGGVWTQQAKLNPSDHGGFFGESVAISGDTIVIGSRLSDVPGVSGAGAVYVFVRSGTFWTEQAKLFASDAESSDDFGGAVAISGDTILVGAEYAEDPDDGTVDDQGAAYVFVRSGTVWAQQDRLAPNDIFQVDQFGTSVAVSDNTAIIGSINASAPGVANAGAAYVYVRSGTVWTQQTKLNATDPANDWFGSAVAIAGGTAVVGSRFDSHSGISAAGSAHVFGRVGTVWGLQAKLIASDAAANDFFGGSVALEGNTIAVGAPADDHPGAANAGSAYVFVRAGGTWIQQAKLIASDKAANDNLGESVAVAGDQVLTGSFFDDHAAGNNSGSVYIYSTNCDNDGDGVPNAGDACPATPAGQPVDHDGRPLRDCNFDCALDAADIQCITDEILNP